MTRPLGGAPTEQTLSKGRMTAREEIKLQQLYPAGIGQLDRALPAWGWCQPRGCTPVLRPVDPPVSNSQVCSSGSPGVWSHSFRSDLENNQDVNSSLGT